MKYLIGLGALVVVVVGYFLLAPAGSPPATDPATAPTAPAPTADPPSAVAPGADAPTAVAPVAPVAIAPENVAPGSPNEDALLEAMAADARESLPSALTETLTLTDALFLPRMRIMEYSYVTTAADARSSVSEMRALIESRAETICVEGREMFGMGVTLRNSFEDRDGNLFRRVYLLPEDCQRFY